MTTATPAEKFIKAFTECANPGCHARARALTEPGWSTYSKHPDSVYCMNHHAPPVRPTRLEA